MIQPITVSKTIGGNNRIEQLCKMFSARIAIHLRKRSVLNWGFLPFTNTPIQKDAWLLYMDAVLNPVSIPKSYKCALFHCLSLTTHQMMNTPEEQKGESL
ncbi:hypothetical protein [Aquibacillus sediminis]|uniref:hypothetical protein n=1 Tax=Aquibacillus sediminis TaxID=2574734 RepID=UPI0011098133|nr:hypothetical protein [Aquibacillus sediminis]